MKKRSFPAEQKIAKMKESEKELDDAQSQELQAVVFNAVEALEIKLRRQCESVLLSFDITRAWRARRNSHAEIALTLSIGALSEEALERVRLNNLKARGLPVPLAAYYRLRLRVKACVESDLFGIPLSFVGVEDLDGQERYSKDMATFKYDHVHLETESGQHHTVRAQIGDLLDRNDPIPCDPITTYLPSKFYFSNAFFEAVGPEIIKIINEKGQAEVRKRDGETYNMQFEEAVSIGAEVGVSLIPALSGTP